MSVPRNRADSQASLSSSQPTLTRHTSRSSLGPGAPFITTSSGVRVRQRSATRFEALRKDVFASRLVRFRGLAQVPHLALDPDLMIDIVSPALHDSAELKYADAAADGLRLVVLSTSSLITFAGKRVGPRQQGGPATDGVRYTPGLTVPLEHVAHLYDSAMDDTALYVHTRVPARLSHRDMEARLLHLPNGLSRDRLIAHTLMLAHPDLVEAAAEHRPLPSGPNDVSLRTWDSSLVTGDDIRRNLAAEAKRRAAANNNGDGAAAGENDEEGEEERLILETSETDLLHIAESRPQLCAKIRVHGDSRVLMSSDAALRGNTHDVVIVCDRALYVGKQRKENKLRQRVPYEAMEAVVVDASKPVCILKLDFTKVSIRGDMSITFPSHRNRDLFVSMLSSAYEGQVVDRLPVSTEEDVFWSKRGLVESQLLRVVGAVKENRFTRAIGATEAKDDGQLPPETLRTCRWLLYTLRADTYRVLTALSGGIGIPDAERDFISRCIVAVFERAGWTEGLLRWATQASLDRSLKASPLAAAGGGTAMSLSGSATIPASTATAASGDLLFHEEQAVAGSVVRHYTAQAGEQYTQAVFAQIVDRYLSDPGSFRPLGFAAEIEEWAGKFLRPILQNTDGELLADEIKMIVALIHERHQRDPTLVAAGQERFDSQLKRQRELQQQHQQKGGGKPDKKSSSSNAKLTKEDAGRIQIGRFLYAKLVHPALTAPLSQGLALVEPAPAQLDNLRRIAVILRAILSRNTGHIFAPESPLADLSDADKRDLAAYAATQFDAAKDLLDGFIFSDVLADENDNNDDAAPGGGTLTSASFAGRGRGGPSRPAAAAAAAGGESSANFVDEDADVQPVLRYSGAPHDVAGLSAHIDENVSLHGHNPRLIAALARALGPYASGIHAALAHTSGTANGIGSCGGGAKADAGSARLKSPVDKKPGANDDAGAATTNGDDDAATAVRNRLEDTVQQLSHEVLDLRRQLEAAKAREHEVALRAARLQEQLAFSPPPGRHASFVKLNGSQQRRRSSASSPSRSSDSSSGSSSNGSSGLSSSSGSSASSGDDGGDRASPRSRNLSMSMTRIAQKQLSREKKKRHHHRGRSGGKHKDVSNPLLEASPRARSVRGGLAPAAQDYGRAAQELHGASVAGVIPRENLVVFGCPLDRYMVGTGAAIAHDPAQDPDL